MPEHPTDAADHPPPCPRFPFLPKPRPVHDIILGVACMALATALKGWTDGWPPEGWLGVLVFATVVPAIASLDAHLSRGQLSASRTEFGR